MNSHKILLEIVPYLQKTKHKLLYKKKMLPHEFPERGDLQRVKACRMLFFGSNRVAS